MKFPFILNLAKIVMLTLLIISLSNCRKDNKVCPEVTFDSTHFDNNELAKIPDWKGDSLFFYSDAGDTAYMVCREQYGDYKSYGTAAGSDVECGQRKFYYYPEYNYSYKSNHPDLNGIRVVIFKESKLSFTPGKPTSFLLFNNNRGHLDGHLLADLNEKSINDSILLSNGNQIYGWKNRDMVTTISLDLGLLKLNLKEGRQWKIHKYILKK
jgi:hypothetical protein